MIVGGAAIHLFQGSCRTGDEASHLLPCRDYISQHMAGWSPVQGKCPAPFSLQPWENGKRFAAHVKVH